MNPRLDLLQPYPFERLRTLLAGAVPPASLRPIPLSIGEPRHTPPAFIAAALVRALGESLGSYPVALGLPQLREAIARWLERRFGLPAQTVRADDMVLPVNGTREALFSFVQAAVDAESAARGSRPLVLMPNPFYQIYEGAALLAGAEPRFLNCTASERLPARPGRNRRGHLESLPGPVPVHARQPHRRRHAGRLPATRAGTLVPSRLRDRLGRVLLGTVFRRSVTAHGTAAGRVSRGQHGVRALRRVPQPVEALERAGPAFGIRRRRRAFLARFRLYRTYHGCAVPAHTQLASMPAWNDEAHVVENRRLYREKFARVTPVLAAALQQDIAIPAGGFYLWPRRRQRRGLRARPVRAAARDRAAGPLPRARDRDRQSRAGPHSHFAGRQSRRLRRGRAPHCRVRAGQSLIRECRTVP